MRDLTDISSGLSILQRKENKRMKIRREMFFISRLLFFASLQKTTEVPRSSFLINVDKLCHLLYNHKDFYTQRTVLL